MAETTAAAITTTRPRQDHRVGNAMVVKKLSPAQPGTLGWMRRYGAALVCVRYRLDPRSGVRYTTVELVVDSRQTAPDAHAKVLLPIDFKNEATRRQAIELGAKWKRREKAWLMSLSTAIQLGLVKPGSCR